VEKEMIVVDLNDASRCWPPCKLHPRSPARI
jgi:hypothetical protein